MTEGGMLYWLSGKLEALLQWYEDEILKKHGEALHTTHSMLPSTLNSGVSKMLTWIANAPRNDLPIGADLIGLPKATDEFTTEELTKMEIVGVYKREHVR